MASRGSPDVEHELAHAQTQRDGVTPSTEPVPTLRATEYDQRQATMPAPPPSSARREEGPLARTLPSQPPSNPPASATQLSIAAIVALGEILSAHECATQGRAEEGVRKLGAIVFGNMTRTERVLFFALGVWLVRSGPCVTIGDMAFVDALGHALAVDASERARGARAASKVDHVIVDRDYVDIVRRMRAVLDEGE